GIRDFHVTGVQTCALPIYRHDLRRRHVDELELLLDLSERDARSAFEAIFLARLDARPFEVRSVAATEVFELPAGVRPAHDRVLSGDVSFSEPKSRRRSAPDEVFRLEEKNASRRDFANRTHGSSRHLRPFES